MDRLCYEFEGFPGHGSVAVFGEGGVHAVLGEVGDGMEKELPDVTRKAQDIEVAAPDVLR